MNDFAAFWESQYPGAFPVGWMLRAAETQWWTRFHSLPFSKQYADTEDERTILLDRQNRLASELLGQGGPIWFVQTQWVTPDGHIDIADEHDPFKESREFPLRYAFSFQEDEGDGEVSTWRVMASQTIWRERAFDPVLLRIADEEAGPTLWLSRSDGTIFAPYDGGVDLFLPSEEQRDALQIKFASWLPMNLAGL